MRILWEENAWEEYCYWQMQDKKTLKRINVLIKDIQRVSFNGIGETGAIKGEFVRLLEQENRRCKQNSVYD